MDHNPFQEEDELPPEEDPDPTGFNNPAKSRDTIMDAEILDEDNKSKDNEEKDKEGLKTTPHFVAPPKKDYRKYERFFAGMPLTTIHKTFEATTQLERSKEMTNTGYGVRSKQLTQRLMSPDGTNLWPWIRSTGQLVTQRSATEVPWHNSSLAGSQTSVRYTLAESQTKTYTVYLQMR